MKGQTIIELKDVKTGKIERHVDNNMMTNALSEILKTRGFIANNDGLDQNNLLKNLLGGIVLFDGALEESADTLQPPSSVNMVGNASMDIVSSDDVTEMGSYNSNESGWQADGSFVAVYDFNTSQANGTIACVCLTSDVGGYIGYGNKTSGQYKSTRKNLDAYSGTQNNYLLSGYNCYFADYTNSKVDVIPSEQINNNSSENYCLRTKKLKFETRKIPLKEVNLRGTKTGWVKVSEREVTLPDAFCSNPSRYIDVVEAEGKIYLFHNYISYGQTQQWESGTDIYAVEIDSSYNVRLITLTNTSGVTINRPKFYVHSGHVIVEQWGEYSYTDTWYRFAIADSSSIDLPTPAFDITRVGYASNGRVYSGNVVLNVVEGESAYTNMNLSTASDGVASVNGSPLSIRRGTNDLNIINIALYLASINNLENPVVKTAEKTMKITYRITM